MAYPTEIKTGNIVENWLFQFGYFNGDAQGNGDGGFSAVTQADGTPNLLNEALDSSEDEVDVDDGTVFVQGDYIKITREIIKITSISTNTLTVQRGQLGTSAGSHSNNAQIYWNNFLGLSFKDIKVDETFYFGTIINKPSIRESIELSTGTSKSSNISINIPDFKYKGDLISKELFGGTNKYINQEVRVFSKINNQSPNRIQTFRLTDISTSGKVINLSLTSHRPWDFISFPQDKSDANTYIPVVYGSYTPNTCRHDAYAINDSLDLFPAPVDYVTSNIHCIAPRSLDGNSGNEGRLHYWDKTAEQFCPILSANGTAFYNDTSISNNSINYGIATPTLHRAYMAKPRILKKNFSVSNFSSWSDTSNIENAVDDRYNTPSTSTFTSSTINLSLLGNSGNTNQTGQVLFMYPLLFEGQAEYLLITVISEIASIAQTGNAYSVSGGNVDYNIALDGILGAGNLCRRISVPTSNSDFTGNSGTTTSSSSDFKTNYNTNKGWDEDDLQLLASITIGNDGYTGTSTAQATFKVYDVVQTVRAKYEDMEVKNDRAIKTPFLYLGCDGLSKSYSGGSGSVTHIHEAHRDLLKKFTGIDNDDSDIDGWSSLNTSRTQTNKEWKIRYWQLEPKELKKELEKLQYEGGFIFRFKADGSMQYIHIPDSPSTTATLTKMDISDIKISPSSFSNLLTTMDINYKKHPAEKKYLLQTLSSNSTSRGKWNILSQENKKSINLDAYVAPAIPTTPSSNKNDDFYTYYDNIFGDIKITVSFTIVNPKFYDIEVGNIIEFDENNMFPKTPMGHNSATWNNLQMMVTSTNRTLGKLSITAREI